MSFGKLYTYPKAPRSSMVLFVAKYNKLDVQICNAFPIKVNPEKGGVGEEYLSKFHTGNNAVTWFLAKQDPNTKLCGSGLKEEITVLRWAPFTNYELLPSIMAWIGPIIGRTPRSPEILKSCEGCELTIRAIEKEIAEKNFLVGDMLTLADLFVVSGLARGYQYVFTKSWAEKHPVVHEYYMRVRSDRGGIFDGILGYNIIRDEPGGTYPDYDGL
ncbi:elongation factor 1-gamma [Colletotrichum cuscutae]|uniref:Elongation factor 1-gamma n=1 Tax=Colletotrichum cuscutae TaxID=1209917 RepID=A0AAI9VDM1_9PEZI|nr:elongation factor 1-gamma [Colletotrichum cuscutae]